MDKHNTVEASELMPSFKAIRIALDKSGAEICFVSGIDRSRLSVLERGFARPHAREREKLARALDVPVALVDQRARLVVVMEEAG